jgi:AhpD family alkylhydroperoxidase
MKLDTKTKELIAVGASVTANCQPCLQHHAAKALEFGADAEEVAVAIEVGKRVRKGASAKMDSFAAILKDVAPAPTGAKDSICCGH